MQTLEEIKKLYPDIDINGDGEADTYKEGLPIIERHNVAVVLKHPNEGSYLVAKWKSTVWNGFITGGIEEGDTLEDTVRSEVREEAGYKNISKIRPLDFTSRALFFHPVKNENRLAHYHLVFAELEDLDKDEVSEKEKSIADFVWVLKDEVLETLTRPSMKSLWDFYVKNTNGDRDKS